MDIAALSMAISQSRVSGAASMKVAKMAMDNQKQQGEQVLEIIEAGKGENLDIKL